MTPAPFSDHDRWVAYNQYLMGALALGVFAVMLTAGGWWHMAGGIVIEEATADGGEGGFAVVGVTDAVFEGAAMFAVGVTLYHFTWRLYDSARSQREIARGQNMAAAMITTTIATALLSAIVENSEEVNES